MHGDREAEEWKERERGEREMRMERWSIWIEMKADRYMDGDRGSNRNIVLLLKRRYINLHIKGCRTNLKKQTHVYQYYRRSRW